MIVGPIEFTTAPLVSGPTILFRIFNLPISTTVVTTWALIFLIFLFFKIGTRNLKINPTKSQIILEGIYEFLETTIEQILGIWKNKYFTFFSTMFLFILTSNIVTFFPVPWFLINNGTVRIYSIFRSPTADLNTTLCLAIITTVVFVGTSIKYNGVSGYLKGFLTPVPFLLPLNLIGELAKPLNISMRLFGNMFAGMIILGLCYMALPWFVPAALHLYFDLFSGLVQTFVFVTLSMVYTQSAIGDAEYK